MGGTPVCLDTTSFSRRLLLTPFTLKPNLDKTAATTSTTRTTLHTALCSLVMLAGSGEEVGPSPRRCCAELAFLPNSCLDKCQSAASSACIAICRPVKSTNGTPYRVPDKHTLTQSLVVYLHAYTDSRPHAPANQGAKLLSDYCPITPTDTYSN